MAKREAIRPKDRFEVFKRDAFRCQYCGRTPPTITLEVDHIIAVTNGGGNEFANLLTSCRDCNVGKGPRPLTAIQPDAAVRLEERREAAFQVQSYNEFLLEQRHRTSAAIERIGAYWYRQLAPRRSLIFGLDRERSIRRFLTYLTEVEILEAVDIAMLRKPPSDVKHDDTAWRYFCGICWTKIREADRVRE
mgnify:CR=1 FL=1